MSVLIKRRVGQTGPSTTFQILQSDNTPMGLSGATYAGKIRDTATGDEITMAGVFTTASVPDGKVTYSWVAADLATPGVYEIEIEVTKGALVYLPVEDEEGNYPMLEVRKRL